jgi:hypothetical protein
MRMLLVLAVIIGIGAAGAASGVGGMVWAGMIMAFVALCVGDVAQRNLEAENRALREELARYKPAPSPDHEQPSAPPPTASDAFLERLRRDAAPR